MALIGFLLHIALLSLAISVDAIKFVKLPALTHFNSLECKIRLFYLQKGCKYVIQNLVCQV